MSELFNEDDLKTFFKEEKQAGTAPKIPIRVSKKPPTPKPVVKKKPKINLGREFLDIFYLILKGAGIFIGIFAISFLVINGPAIYKNIHYFYKDTEYPIKDNPAATKGATLADNTLSIPKISVNAPITWQVPENEVLAKLQNGVASYAGTALPGEEGNVFIFGHSSYYLWAEGNYKDVFALLDNLEPKDQIFIKYRGQMFTYEVTSKETVLPDNLSVLTSGSGKNLKLMTCVPIGTNLKRLIINAKQI